MRFEMVKDHRKPTLLFTLANSVLNTKQSKKKSNVIITNNMDYTMTSSSSTTSSDGDGDGDDSSPMLMSPWNHPSPLPISPFVASLRRHDGHVYSLAAKDGLLYTGSESKNIRVWKNMQEFDAFKSSSGFVKAIVISGDRIFTGHHDGRIRVWTIHHQPCSVKAIATAAETVHKQVGTLPTFFDVVKASVRPKNYVRVKPRRKTLWIKHADAISCLSIDEQSGLLYSASWDRTFKAWQIENSKCVDSVKAHDDAVNAVVAGGNGLVYTGSADGTVRVWKRKIEGKTVRHFLRRTLLDLDCAVTALAVGESGAVVYCGSSDGLVYFWEVEKELPDDGGVLKGHQVAVLCLAAAGRLVFSGSADNTICVWRREGVVHTCLKVLEGHTGPVKCLAVEEDKESSDGGDRKWKVYSGSIDNSVKVWSVSETASDLQYGGWNSK